MWWLIKTGLGIVVGPITKIAGGWFDYRSTKARIQGELMEEQIRADVEFGNMKVAMAEINQGWWVTRWIVPGFAYPLIAWWTCIIIDSIYQFPNWNVAKLPDPLQDWAGQIIMSFFLVRGVEIFANQLHGGGLFDTIRDIFTGGRESSSDRGGSSKVVTKRNPPSQRRSGAGKD